MPCCSTSSYHIINNLLQYASPDEFAGYIGVEDVNELVEDSVKLVKHLQKKTQFDSELDLQATRAVEINAQELQQVIVNLVVNAIHALSEERWGKIVLRTFDWNDKGVM